MRRNQIMHKGKRLMLALAAVATIAIVPGCFKVKEVLTVMPDGSGKLEMRMGYNEQLVKDTMKEIMDASGMGGRMGGGGGMGPMGGMKSSDPTKVDLEGLEKNMEGFVAFTKPVSEDGENGWKYVNYTAYFDDINKVKMFSNGRRGRTEKGHFAFEKKGDGFVLSGVDKMGAGGAGAEAGGAIPPDHQEMAKLFMEKLVKDLSVEITVKMPGNVTEIEGFKTKDGREASLTITKDDLKDMKDLQKLSETRDLKVVCGPSTASEKEVAAFKAELEKAKADWETMKAEAKAKAKEKEKAAGGDEGKKDAEEGSSDK